MGSPVSPCSFKKLCDRLFRLNVARRLFQRLPRGGHTRSLSEHGSQAPHRRWYLAHGPGRVGRRWILEAPCQDGRGPLRFYGPFRLRLHSRDHDSSVRVACRSRPLAVNVERGFLFLQAHTDSGFLRAGALRREGNGRPGERLSDKRTLETEGRIHVCVRSRLEQGLQLGRDFSLLLCYTQHFSVKKLLFSPIWNKEYIL